MRRPAIAAATLVAVLLAGACSEPASPEAELEALVQLAEEAAERKARGELMARVSPGYSDARGNDRADIDRLLRLVFLRQKSVGLLVDIDSVDLFGEDAAEIVLTVGMAATNDRLLGFSADAYRFELELVKDGGDWQVIGARWGEIGGTVR